MADYTYMNNAVDAARNDRSIYWFLVKKEEMHEAVFEVVSTLEKTHNWRREQNLQNMRLYGDMDTMGLSSGGYTQSQPFDSKRNRVTLNVIQNTCDTIASKIAKNRPKPMFLTDAGDWYMQKKAQSLQKYIDGQFYYLNAYQLGQRAFADGCIFDIGGIKVYRHGDHIKLDRIFAEEIMVDEAESFYGDPKSYHQKKLMARDILIKLFPKSEEKLRKATRAGYQSVIYQNLTDQLKVVESWRLASGKKDKNNEYFYDGRHTICVENETLLDEEYDKPYPPFVFFKWSSRLRGFYGQPLAEQLTGLQIEMNKILRTIQISQHLLAVPKVLVDVGSKIVKTHLNNEIGGIISYAGTPPQFQSINPSPTELFTHLQFLYQKAFERAGVSQLSANSQKPEGLDSGKAIRTYQDIESDRFALTQQNYEQMFLDLTRLILDETKEIASRKDGKHRVMLKDVDGFSEINWKEIDMERDKYILQVFPTNYLSETPAGKFQDIKELLQAGFLDKDYAAKLMDFPDVKGVMKLITAPYDDIMLTITQILEKGEYNAPEEFQNLALGIRLGQSSYLKAKVDGVPRDRLELLQRWIAQANIKLKSAIQPPMPQVPQLAKPQPLPQSNLIPQAGPQTMAS